MGLTSIEMCVLNTHKEVELEEGNPEKSLNSIAVNNLRPLGRRVPGLESPRAHFQTHTSCILTNRNGMLATTALPPLSGVDEGMQLPHSSRPSNSMHPPIRPFNCNNNKTAHDMDYVTHCSLSTVIK